VVVVGLSLAACAGGRPDKTANPPPPEPVEDIEPPTNPPAPGHEVDEPVEPEKPEPPIHRNPPPAQVDPVDEVEATDNPPGPEPLPTWDEVKSGHPEGATNPPRPVLIVTPDGDCHKSFVSPMIRPPPGKPFGDRVQACEYDECGTPVQCPPKAAELLAAHEAASKEDGEE